MPTLQDLRDKRASAWSQAQEFLQRADTDGVTLTPEDEAAWQRSLADIDTLTEQIENREKTETLDKRFAEIEADTIVLDQNGDPSNRAADEYRAAFGRFIRGGLSGLETEERQLMQANFGPLSRAEGTTSGAAGGYTVPQGFWAKVTETMKYFGGVLQSGVETHDTDTGNDIPWPTNDDTSNVGALLSENTQIGTQDVTFGQRMLHAYTYTSQLILASWQFLQDTGIDAEGFIARKAGQRLGRIYNTHWTTGDGAFKPQGFITGATVGKTAAGASAIVYDDVIDLVHSVDVAYRSDPSVGFQFHDLVLAYLRKLKDSQNRPLWEPSLRDAAPSTFAGYGYVVNNDMDSTVATTKKTMAFGAWNAGYVVRRVTGGQLMRLEERYADFLQVGFFGFGRMDGLVQDASAIKVLQQP